MTVSIESTLAGLQDTKQRWARLPVEDKIGQLRQLRDRVVAHAQEWVDAGAGFKGLSPDHPLIGTDEWLAGPYPTLSWLTDALRTLSAVRDGADPLEGVPVRTTATGQVVARVFPATGWDRLLLNGYELDVWMQPGVTADRLRETVAVFYAEPDPPGRVTLVLGAGNVSAISVLDVLYAMFVHGDVVVLKMNPVNEAYGPTLEKIFAPLVDAGFLRFVYGGGDVGAALVRSDLVDAVHITGSARTFEAIVWGNGPEAEERRRRNEPLLRKPISSELGGVGPTIVLPGDWTDADIAFQADHVASQRLLNSGHACVASQVLVLPESWPLKDRFLAAVRQSLTAAPQREPFYPGTDDKVDRFLAENPDAEMLAGRQKRALLTRVDSASEHPAFAEEYFGPVYVTTEIPGGTTAEYLHNAVAFANERLMGDLSANLIVDPVTARRLGPELDLALAELRAGNIGVNVWAGVMFIVNRAAWGAYAGNPLDDIRSGSGVVHNSLMLDRPQKNVMWAPFRAFPRSARHGALTMALKPPWFISNRTQTNTAKQLTYFVADPRIRRLPRLIASTLRG